MVVQAVQREPVSAEFPVKQEIYREISVLCSKCTKAVLENPWADMMVRATKNPAFPEGYLAVPNAHRDHYRQSIYLARYQGIACRIRLPMGVAYVV